MVTSKEKRAFSPWASGPKEILRDGLDLLRSDSESNRRLAMIIVDNAVELTIKTFLGLPKRITGIHVPRARYQEIAESFPKLLDAAKKGAVLEVHELRDCTMVLEVRRQGSKVASTLAHASSPIAFPCQRSTVS